LPLGSASAIPVASLFIPSDCLYVAKNEYLAGFDGVGQAARRGSQPAPGHGPENGWNEVSSNKGKQLIPSDGVLNRLHSGKLRQRTRKVDQIGFFPRGSGAARGDEMDVPCPRYNSTDLQKISQIPVATAASKSLLAARRQDSVAGITFRAES